MKKTVILAACFMTVTAVLCIVSYILLPQTVVTQLSFGSGKNTTTMPKLIAIILPAMLGIGGGCGAILTKADVNSSKKRLLVSGVGIIVFVILLIVNL